MTATTTSSGRYYTWKGEDYPSVTTLLQALSKPFLPAAARKVAAELAVTNLPKYLELAWKDRTFAITTLKRDAKQQWDDTATLGTAVHKAVENWISYGWPAEGYSPEIMPFMSQWVQFVNNRHLRVERSEFTVYSRAHGGGYAGTADLLAYLNDELWLLDLKTGKGVYSDYALQLAAYRFAEFIGDENGETAMPHVERCGIVHLRPDKCELVEMRCGEDEFAAFLAVAVAWIFQNVTSKTVIIEGAPHV